MDREILVTPVYGHRALSLGKTLVVADLHIGIEHELRGRGVSVPSQVHAIKRSLFSIIERTTPKELIILGDVKHNIPSTSLQEYREVPQLFDYLSDLVEITIVKGNHDGNLEKLLPDYPILDYLEREGVLLAHGHAWIKAKNVDANFVVLAHSHPAVAFVDQFSRTIKEPAWIKGRFNENILNHYRVRNIPEFIVMPAFNPLITGMPFNRNSKKELLGPYFRSGVIDLESAHAYLLDGTDLGEISGLKASNEKAKQCEDHGNLNKLSN
jgi:putative SbcD/Mre11-related phosphoesterase